MSKEAVSKEAMSKEVVSKEAMSNKRAWLPVLACVAAVGCVSSSTASDLSSVREMTHVSQLPEVDDTDVEAVTTQDAQRMLEQPLDADAAVRIAVLENRELRATLRELGIARGRLRQAGLLPNPTVEAEILPEQNTELELRVEYDITGLLLAPMRSRAAAPDLAAARYRAAGAVLDLGARVRTAFVALQAAEQRLALAQQSLDALAAGRDATNALLEAGNVPALDAETQSVAYERMRVEVARQELDAASAREAVLRLLGLHGTQGSFRVAAPLTAAPDKPAIPEDAERTALLKSFELQETKQRLEGLARRAGVTLAAGWLPDVSVDVHALQRDSEAAGSSNEKEWRFGAGVSVGIPLFDRGQGERSALQAEFDALLERYYGKAVDLRSAVREARNRVVSAHARARQYQDVIVPAQARVVAHTALQYNAMQIGVFQLLQARREELDIGTAYVETLREYWSATAELDGLLAGGHAVMGGAGQAPAAGTSMQATSMGGH